MKNIKILRRFRDKVTHKIYNVDEVVEVEEKRYKEILTNQAILKKSGKIKDNLIKLATNKDLTAVKEEAEEETTTEAETAETTTDEEITTDESVEIEETIEEVTEEG